MRWDNVFGTSQFQVSSMVYDGDYVYMFGTPEARATARSAWRASAGGRAQQDGLKYWRDGRWTPTRDANTASVLFGGQAGGILRPPQCRRKPVGDDLPRPGAQRDHDPARPAHRRGMVGADAPR